MPSAPASAPASLIDVLTHAATNAGCLNALRCRETLEEASEKRLPLIDSLLDSKLCDEEQFFDQLAKTVRMPFVPDGAIEEAEGGLHTRFPAKLALRHRLYPVSVSNMEVTLVTYDPFNLDARQAVGQELRKKVRWQIASRHRILEALHQGYGVGAENFEELLEGREDMNADDMAQEVNVLDEQDEEATVMNFVNQVFREALRERATDIHVEPLEKDLRIRYRVDGRLLEVPVPPNMRILQASLISRLKIMAHLDIAERRLPQDGRINLELDGDPIDVRVATIPSVNGESVALRLLTRQKFDMSKLGLDAHTEATVRKLLASPNGIILVTGPTGSGKSTTLYTWLRELNTKDRRIVTIEDPVENKLDGVVQIAVKPEIDLTFAKGLRSILRGDPNVIMVGEMRDQETVEIAIRGALTGHLVLSTLHTNDAVSGISRLLDMGIEPFLISSSVRAFQAQRLVRTLCPSCKVPAHYEDSFLQSVGFPVEQKSGLCKPVGCRSCRNTGFMGRLAIMEICTMSPVLAEKINAHAPVAELKTQALKDGMIPMRQYGIVKAAQGITTIEEVLTVTAANE